MADENVKTLLVIGNGFDLAHGLKTKYTDFLDFVNKRWEAHIKEIIDIQMVKRKVLLDKATPSEALQIAKENKKFEENLHDQYWREVSNNSKNFKLIKDERNKIQDGIVQNILTLQNIFDYTFKLGNFWIEYFNHILKDRNNRIGEGWIDFEREIERVIEQLEKLLLSPNDFKNQEIFLEEIMGGYFKQPAEIIVQEFVPKLNWDLKILTLFLEFYLMTEEKNSNCKPKKFFEKLNVNAVISYNYTNTFKKLYQTNKRKISVYFIHGRLGKHNLILGIGETLTKELENQFTICASFKKFFQLIKYQLSNDYKNSLPRKLEANDKFQIVFYGHSLDTTDKESLQWLLEKSSTLKIKIYYYDEDAYNQQIANAIQILGKEQLIKNVNKGKVVFLPI